MLLGSYIDSPPLCCLVNGLLLISNGACACAGTILFGDDDSGSVSSRDIVL